MWGHAQDHEGAGCGEGEARKMLSFPLALWKKKI